MIFIKIGLLSESNENGDIVLFTSIYTHGFMSYLSAELGGCIVCFAENERAKKKILCGMKFDEFSGCTAIRETYNECNFHLGELSSPTAAVRCSCTI